MKLKDYLYDQKYNIIIQIVILIYVDIIIYFTHSEIQDMFIISFIIIALNAAFYIASFVKKRAYYNKLIAQFTALDEKNLISEFIKEPKSREAKIYYNIIKRGGFELNNKISDIQKEKDEYREYIEGLVHEIKLPISVIKLISDKFDNEDYNSIKEENEKIETYIEQALYYARSNNVEKDYFISDTDLSIIIKKALKKHKSQFISKNIKPELKLSHKNVLSDAKWLEFIISQLLDNAVKYCDYNNPVVRITIEDFKNGAKLSITNNGITIPSEDISKVFQNGFTGQNGRNIQHSTGMGLYLVNRLCTALNHKVEVTSGNGKTTFNIIFSSL